MGAAAPAQLNSFRGRAKARYLANSVDNRIKESEKTERESAGGSVFSAPRDYASKVKVGKMCLFKSVIE